MWTEVSQMHGNKVVLYQSLNRCSFANHSKYPCDEKLRDLEKTSKRKRSTTLQAHSPPLGKMWLFSQNLIRIFKYD